MLRLENQNQDQNLERKENGRRMKKSQTIHKAKNALKKRKKGRPKRHGIKKTYTPPKNVPAIQKGN